MGELSSMTRYIRPALAGLALAGAAGSAAATLLAAPTSVTAPHRLPRQGATQRASHRATHGASRGATPRAPQRGTQRKTVRRLVPSERPEVGVASWYSGGGRTADGAAFRPGALTAASPSLPFGTRLRVCRGGHCILVRVDDRGPFVGGRILDLTAAGARDLGFQSAGTAEVSATPVRVVREILG